MKLVGVTFLALGCVVATAVFLLQRSGQAQFSGVERSTSNALCDGRKSPEQLAIAWLEMLEQSEYAELRFQSLQKWTRRPLNDPTAEPIIDADVTVTARVEMEPRAYNLVAWDNDSDQRRPGGRPAIVLSLSDGNMKEGLWYPAFQQYRTIEYPAPTPGGANDTKYAHGCQIGNLLQTWIGPDAEIREMFKDGFAIAKINPELQEINGRPCTEYFVDAEPDLDPFQQPGKEKRSGSYYLDEDGSLVRMTITATMVRGNEVVEVVAVDDYDFTFYRTRPVDLPTGSEL